MKAAIDKHNVSEGYKKAVASAKEREALAAKGSTEEAAFYRAQLWADYQKTLETFKKELQGDFKAAKESFDLTTMPYSEWAEELSNDIFKFFLYEGKITPEYNKINGKVDRTKILKFDNAQIVERYTTEEAAIERVYNDTIVSEFNKILTYWGTAGTLTTEYSAKAPVSNKIIKWCLIRVCIKLINIHK